MVLLLRGINGHRQPVTERNQSRDREMTVASAPQPIAAQLTPPEKRTHMPDDRLAGEPALSAPATGRNLAVAVAAGLARSVDHHVAAGQPVAHDRGVPAWDCLGTRLVLPDVVLLLGEHRSSLCGRRARESGPCSLRCSPRAHAAA